MLESSVALTFKNFTELAKDKKFHFKDVFRKILPN